MVGALAPYTSSSDMSGFNKPQANRIPQFVLVFYIFVGSLFISDSEPLENEINQAPYFVKIKF